MRTPEEIVQGVLAWALESDEIRTGYDYVTGEKILGELPDVMVEIQDDRLTLGDSRFPMQALQQVWLNVYAMVVSIGVDNQDGQGAARQLRRIQADLKQRLIDDGTLDGRVLTVSPYFNFDLTPPFVEYDDGTKAREMRLVLAVAELVEE